jgi:tRNA(fMet)-specific endonuclease VapC
LSDRLLDTDTLIDLVRARPRVTDRYLAMSIGVEPMFLSTVSLFEFKYGMERSNRHAAQALALDRLLETISVSPFEANDADATAQLKASLAVRGRPIGSYDVMIAGQALARGWTLVTSNAREFSRVPGLIVENWRAA